MKKAYKKALEVIKSCKTDAHIITAYNYIHNFRVLFGSEDNCKGLSERLMEQCAMKRKLVRRV